MNGEQSMTTQLGLFDQPAQRKDQANGVLSREKYEGALVCSAIGDALGWPTEFFREDSRRKPPFDLPLQHFVSWDKRVGGKWWGYSDTIRPGEYSDDTQLMLAVARCISETGRFEPEQFAYTELPLWLHYERGGGRSIKTAARALLRPKVDWLHNFYRQQDLEYRTAGANGAAMRSLPIALAHAHEEAALIRDVFLNAVITHGHPRAILGALIFGLAVRYVLMSGNGSERADLLHYVGDVLPSVGHYVAEDAQIRQWIADWEAPHDMGKGAFRSLFQHTRDEAERYLVAIPQFQDREVADYYRFVGALDRETKGSGLSTVCAALFLYLQRGDYPAAALYAAVNQYGSDTDTIAVFLGALLGAEHGMGGVPDHLKADIQDRDYLVKTADRLHGIAHQATHDVDMQVVSDKPFLRRETLLRILAWEIGLHEMFWDALAEGDIVMHPTLGRGAITQKNMQPIPRDSYVAKLIHISFDCGQTCVFHSRVQHDLKVSESLAEDVERALRE